jgi:hypothetical protein
MMPLGVQSGGTMWRDRADAAKLLMLLAVGRISETKHARGTRRSTLRAAPRWDPRAWPAKWKAAGEDRHEHEPNRPVADNESPTR